MVLLGLAEDRVPIPVPAYMATTPKRSNRLHNFTLPSSLKWGSQRYLRCANSSAAANAETDASGSRDRRSPASWSDDSTANWMMEFKTERNVRSSRMRKPRIDGGDGDNDEGIDAVRKKLVLDLKTAAEKMKDEILRKEVEEEEKEEERESSQPPPPAEQARPWNLRTRRREEIKPFFSAVGNGKRLKIEEKKPNSSSPLRNNINGNGNSVGAVKLPKLRSNCEKTKQREKFSVQLSKKEIEEDFAAMVGRRPPRRPIKRPRDVQRQMDTLFPGLWLTEVTADLYKVTEASENGGGKVRKGKGKMHLSESDDEE
ncbi:unnamed protein product [Lupinus luteus]|uniref:DUF1639 family protein n=1 Tax=Lupinus luteus TaxID=3873 RepID=A0AAV1WX65_LUPLU